MKRSAGRVFIRTFIKTLIILGIIFTVGVLSYRAITYYWQPKNKEEIPSYQENDTQKPTELIDKRGNSKNLILCVDDKSGEIMKLVLEVFDSKDAKLTYITIPVKTQLTLSNTLYQKLTLDNPEIPQLIKLSTITKYLDGAKAYGDELLIIEELLKTEINYYTAIPGETYDTMFTEKNVRPLKQYDSLPMEVFIWDFRKYLNALDTKKQRTAFLKDIYPKIQSNISLEDKVGLLDYCDDSLFNHISYEILPGKNLNNDFVIDMDATEKLLTDAVGSD